MLTIRLQRVGKRNQAVFRIVLAEKQRAVKKQAVEILGHYNPRSKDFGLKDEARLKYWLGQRVEVSPTVHNLLVSKGLIGAPKVHAWRPKVKSSEALAKEESPKEKPEATAEPPAPAAAAEKPETASTPPALPEEKPKAEPAIDKPEKV